MSEDELEERQRLFHNIKKLVLKEIPGAELYMFGSTANRLALRASDIDILVLLKKENQYGLLRKLYTVLDSSKKFSSIDAIEATAVPIISAVHKDTGNQTQLLFTLNRDKHRLRLQQRRQPQRPFSSLLAD